MKEKRETVSGVGGEGRKDEILIEGSEGEGNEEEREVNVFPCGVGEKAEFGSVRGGILEVEGGSEEKTAKAERE